MEMILALIAVKLISGFASASMTCEVQKVNFGFLTEDRARVITDIDGRKTYLIGHNHGDRDIFERMRSDIQQSGGDGAELRRRLQILLAENELALKNFKDDEKVLERLIEESDSFFSLGVETDYENLRKLYDHRAAIARWVRSSTAATALSDEETSGLTKLLFGGPQIPFYVLLEKSQDLRLGRISIDGFVPEEAAKTEGRRLADFENAVQTMRAKLGNPSWTEVKARRLIEKVRRKRIDGTLDPTIELISLRREFEATFEHEDLELAWSMAQAAIRMEEASIERDLQSAELIAKASQTNVVFVGKNHLETLARFSSEKCRNRKSDHQSEN